MRRPIQTTAPVTWWPSWNTRGRVCSRGSSGTSPTWATCIWEGPKRTAEPSEPRALGAIYTRAAGRFRITSAGVADLNGGLAFLRRAIDAGARFDIGNVHLRGGNLRKKAERASRFFGDRPLWVTEHGYPSRPDPQAQALYLSSSIPALRAGGADQVFVTLRDIDEFGPDSPFASEGILGKPAWNLILGLNRPANRRIAGRRSTAR